MRHDARWAYPRDLAETCDPLSDLLGWEDRDDGGLAFDGVVEGKLGCQAEGTRNARFSNGGESACNRVVELGCYQPVFDFAGRVATSCRL